MIIKINLIIFHYKFIDICIDKIKSTCYKKLYNIFFKLLKNIFNFPKKFIPLKEILKNTSIQAIFYLFFLILLFFIIIYSIIFLLKFHIYDFITVTPPPNNLSNS